MVEPTRRDFLGTVATGSLACGAFLTDAIGAAAAALTPAQLAARPTHGPTGELVELVRFVRETPADAIVLAAVARLRAGLPIEQLGAATLLAGLEDVRPRPVGFQFHCVLQLPAVWTVACALPPAEQPLPFLYALTVYKRAQTAMATRSPWSLPAAPTALPSEADAGSQLSRALDEFDLDAADAAITALVRNGSRAILIAALLPWTMRDFADVGHHPIFGTAAFRLLDTIGWKYAEPLLRSLVHGFVLAGATSTTAPFADSRALARRQLATEPDRATRSPADPAALDAPRFTRATMGESSGSALGAISAYVAALPTAESIERGFAAVERVGLELLLENPGLLAVHATTSARALRELAARTRDRELQLVALFQAASWCPLWRKAFGGAKQDGDASSLDAIEREAAAAAPPTASAAELLSDHGRIDRRALAVQLVGALSGERGTTTTAADRVAARSAAATDYRAAARALVVAKGREAHDYKFFAAIDEAAAPPLPATASSGPPPSAPDPLPLATLTYYLRPSSEPDFAPVAEARGALSKG